MYQIVGCSLANALKNFGGKKGKEDAKKIEFKDEILFIMNNYHQNPEILKPGVSSKITKRVFVDSRNDKGKIVYETKYEEVKGKDNVYLHEEVIRYADNDTKVLEHLYESMDKLCKEVLDANITDFLTAGSMAWYGFVSNLPDSCLEIKYDKNRNKIQPKIINSKLYKLERSQEDFIRQSVKGGRVCPRQHVFEAKNDKNKGVYLDISGMYASIMKNEILPFGKANWKTNEQLATLNNTIKSYEKKDWRKLYEQLTKDFGMFVAEVEFRENPMNLEPIVQYKSNDKTRYTVEKRTDILTSIDIALIIASGGAIYNITKSMYWESFGNVMNPWIVKCNNLKKEGELTGNSAKKSFGKLLANSAYGQTLKRDQSDITRIISTFEEADDFVTKNKLKNIFDCGDFTILKGEKIVSQETFITSRCSFIGSFVLAYTRGMVFDICEVACPNRYNEKGINEQPIYGDTDSLVFREW